MNSLSSMHRNLCVAKRGGRQLISDGTLSSNWILPNDTTNPNGSTTINKISSSTTEGNGGGAAISAGSFQYGYIDATKFITGITTLKGRKLEFDIRCPSGSLINVYFGCNVSGAGQMWRLETRTIANSYSGIASTTSWTIWNAPSGNNIISSLSGNKWYTVVITIDINGNAKYTYNGTNGPTTPYPIADYGTYIGIQGDGLAGGYVDNIYIT